VLNYFLFGQADNSAAVVFGQDNWMFYQAEGVADLIENNNPLSLEEMQKMANVLEQRRAWLSSYGIDYYVIFPPLKFALYEEMLPSHFKKRNPLSRRDQFGKYLIDSTNVNYIELKDALFEAKTQEDGPIYFRYDSHWNMTGALYGYGKMIRSMAVDHPELGNPMTKDQFDWELVKTYEGDLAKLISLNEVLVREEQMPSPKQEYKASKVTSRTYSLTTEHKATATFEQPDTSLPSLLVDHDSFSNYLMPYLSQHFHRSVFSLSPLFSAEIIKQEMPDVVITEMTERSFSAIMLGNEDLLINELEALKRSHPHTEILSGQR